MKACVPGSLCIHIHGSFIHQANLDIAQVSPRGEWGGQSGPQAAGSRTSARDDSTEPQRATTRNRLHTLAQGKPAGTATFPRSQRVTFRNGQYGSVVPERGESKEEEDGNSPSCRGGHQVCAFVKIEETCTEDQYILLCINYLKFTNTGHTHTHTHTEVLPALAEKQPRVSAKPGQAGWHLPLQNPLLCAMPRAEAQRKELRVTEPDLGQEASGLAGGHPLPPAAEAPMSPGLPFSAPRPAAGQSETPMPQGAPKASPPSLIYPLSNWFFLHLPAQLLSLESCLGCVLGDLKSRQEYLLVASLPNPGTDSEAREIVQ